MKHRTFLRLVFYSLPAFCIAEGFLVEPKRIRLRNVTLSNQPTCRLVHFTDLHHKGDKGYLKTVVERINQLGPDIVCFTGDIVEDKSYLDEALVLLKEIGHPLFGVPGNHDYWSGASFSRIAECFDATGGAWLVDRSVTTVDGSILIVGLAGRNPIKVQSQTPKRILLMHYPETVTRLRDQSYDLLLAGHSHGGQVRIPFWGAPLVPYGVGKYDMGLFTTKAGPLYVNPGIGYYYLPVRFLCRPEITIIHC